MTPPGQRRIVGVDEQEIINIAQRLMRANPRAVRVAIGDDCAVYRPPGATQDMVFTTDMLHEDVHFTMATHTAEDVGWKAMARGLSDIAAMGAQPRFALLSLALTAAADLQWVEGFYRGLLKAGVPVIGGDLARTSKLSCDIIVCGGVPAGKALLRSAAQAGDGIFVSGLLGGSAAGLRTRRGKPWRRHLHPEPRLQLGSFLRKKRLANACMDISDGISADLWRIARASGIAAHLDGKLPLFPGATIGEALHGGEDYELLFTAPARAQVPDKFEGLPLTRIGTVGAEKQVTVTWKGKVLEPLGFDHFEER